MRVAMVQAAWEWREEEWGALATLPCQGLSTMGTGHVRGVGKKADSKCCIEEFVEMITNLGDMQALRAVLTKAVKMRHPTPYLLNCRGASPQA